jgi:hypothetical protein
MRLPPSIIASPLVQHGVLSTLSYALHLTSRCVGGMPVPTARWCGPRAVRFADRAVGAKSASSRPGRSHPFAVDAALASPRTPRGHIVPHPPCLAHLLATDVQTKSLSASPPRKPCRYPPSLRSVPVHAHSHCPSVTMSYTSCLSHPVTLSSCAHV